MNSRFVRNFSMIILSACLALSSRIWSQTDQDEKPKEHSVWHHVQSDVRFSIMMQRLDDLVKHGQGDFSLLYIGGSHVQAGWLGHELRNQWSRFAPHVALSRGMMLPYRMANTNTPTHFRTNFSGTWKGYRCPRSVDSSIFESAPVHTGIAAEAMTTSANWSHWAYQPDSALYSFKEIEVWTTASRNEIAWTGALNVTTMEPLPHDIGWKFELSEQTDTISFQFTTKDTSEPLKLYGLLARPYASNDEHPTFTIHEWGHNGCKSAHLKTTDGWNALVQRTQPDLVLIGVGINDAHVGSEMDILSYRQNMKEFIEHLLLSDKEVAVLLMSNTDGLPDQAEFQKNNSTIGSCLEEIAAETAGVGFYDLNAAMGGPGSARDWHERGWVKKDWIHFESEGYIQLSELIFESWMEAYSKWQLP